MGPPTTQRHPPDVTRPTKAADTAVYPDTLGAATEAISDASSVPVFTDTSRVRDMESYAKLNRYFVHRFWAPCMIVLVRLM